MYEYDMFYIVK